MLIPFLNSFLVNIKTPNNDIKILICNGVPENNSIKIGYV